MESLIQDFRYAVRQLARNPGFTLVAVVTLALGIGANTTIFSAIESVLLKQLPVRDPGQLTVLRGEGQRGASFSNPFYRELATQATGLSGLLAYTGAALNLSANGQADRVPAQMVSGNFFQVLGVEPEIGRLLTADDERPDAAPATVLSHGFWQSRFAGDSRVIGSTVRLNGYPVTVVGVAGAGFFGMVVGAGPNLWVPLALQPRLLGFDRLQMWNNFLLVVVARLRNERALPAAQAEVNARARQIIEAAPLRPNLRDLLLKRQLNLLPAAGGIGGYRTQLRQPLAILLIVTALVLLIACANMANLLLARGSVRAQEIAMRLALGASQSRLIRQMITESFILALIGALAGFACAFWATDALGTLLADPSPRYGLISNNAPLTLLPDGRVLLFSLGLAVVATVGFGLVPAFRTTRPEFVRGLPAGGRRLGLGKALVVVQVALTLVLLNGAGLFVRTLQNLEQVDLGFDAQQVTLLSVKPTDSASSAGLNSRLLERVRGMPLVEAASIAEWALFEGSYIDGVVIEGYAQAPGEDMGVYANKVEPRFFETMGIQLRRGRDFESADGPAAPRVAIVNETFARRFFPGAEAVGQRIGFGGARGVEIVGIIGDTKYNDLRAAAPPTLYLPFAQAADATTERTLHVRTVGNAAAVTAEVRRVVAEVNADLPVYDVTTVGAVVSHTIWQERLVALLSTLFGILGLSLATTGLYGLMAYAVARRTRELGIRIALGASRSSVLWMVLRESLAMVGLGVAIGLPVAFAGGRLLTARLFGLSAHDPATIAGAILLFTIAATAASLIPARRGSVSDPMMALRTE